MCSCRAAIRSQQQYHPDVFMPSCNTLAAAVPSKVQCVFKCRNSLAPGLRCWLYYPSCTTCAQGWLLSLLRACSNVSRASPQTATVCTLRHTEYVWYRRFFWACFGCPPRQSDQHMRDIWHAATCMLCFERKRDMLRHACLPLGL